MSQLSPTYTGARNLGLVAVSAMTVTAVANDTIDVSVIGLDISKAPLSTVAAVCLVMLLIAGFGLIMGWAHTSPQIRAKVSSRFDLGVTAVVMIVGISYILYVVKDISVDLSAKPAAVVAVFCYSAILGWVIAMWLLRISHFAYLLANQYDKLIKSKLYIYLLRRGAVKFSAWATGTLYTVALISGMNESVYWTSLWVGVTALTVSMVISIVSFILPGQSAIEGEDYIQAAIEQRGDSALRRDLRKDTDKIMSGKHAVRPMYTAAAAGWRSEVERLIQSGYDPDTDRDPQGWTALMIACAHSHEEVVEVLLDAGADPNMVNNLGRTALMYSCLYQKKYQVQMLINNGANPNLRGGKDVIPALHKAVENDSPEIIEMLLNEGANPKMTDSRGLTAIEIAEQQGLGEVAVRLRKIARQRSNGKS